MNTYVQDIAYHSAFQAVQSPATLSFVAASQHHVPPDASRPFRYLELGCGQGATLNALAAACPHGEFIGVDFNGGLLGLARAQAERAELANVRYVQAAFSGLATAALADCDYVACNGTWSWLDDNEKSALQRVVGETLKDGGLFYLGYASLGRHPITPMWHLLRRLTPAPPGGSLERIAGGIGLLLELRDQGSRYLAGQPSLLAVLDSAQGQLQSGDRAALENLAHNALAEPYTTELVDEVAGSLAPLGLQFCGTADLFLNDPDLCLPATLRARHDGLATRLQQELLKDFMRSTLVRRDVFIRGRHDSTPGEFRDLRATLTLPQAAARQQVAKPSWTGFRFDTAPIAFVLDRLSAGTTALADIAGGSAHGPAALRDAFLKLAACPGFAPCIGPLADVSHPPRSLRPSSTFNAQALAAAGLRPVLLACPVLGSCIELPGQEAAFLAALLDNGMAATDFPATAASRQWFLDERLPLLQRLEAVVPA